MALALNKEAFSDYMKRMYPQSRITDIMAAQAELFNATMEEWIARNKLRRAKVKLNYLKHLQYSRLYND